MQIVSCPSCGAQVQFRSHASVVAVCEFCRATVMKDADAVKDLGKMSSVLEDFTRIQIGTAGVVGGRNFSVVGRIQLRYSAGMWNEWFILFDDAATGWLGDSSGLYTLTTEAGAKGDLPAFESIQPGKLYTIAGQHYTAAEKRSAECIGGQGELPFRVGEGWQARVADFRAGANFVTLDYSDSDTPVLYNGVAVTLEEMQCQLLRDDDQIKESAGKYRGKLDALECPSCGTAIKYLPGVTTSLVCPSCQAQLDAAGPQAQILAQGEKVERVRTTIPLGATAKINGADYQAIGVMVRADDEGTEWTEYLLYTTRSAFFWLVETDEGWSRANVMSSWPAWQSTVADHADIDKASYRKLYEYPATVKFAAGAFNWRVAAGDVVRVFEFESGQVKLAAELTADELTWSRSTPVAFDQVKAWFGNGLRVDPLRKLPSEALPSSGVTHKFLWWVLGLNAIPLLFNFFGTFPYIVFGLLAIYLPAKLFAAGDKGKQ
jgi:ribosomal protein L37AE/L43A